MSSNGSTFFKKLKETCRKIDDDVTDVKKKLSEDPEGNEELAAKRIRNYQDRIKTLKTQANELKFFLEPKLAHTGEFIQNFKELIAETEVQVTKQEDYLKQYGYKPLESVPKILPDDTSASPVNQLKEIKGSSTPTLLDYGIVQFRNKKSSVDDLTIPPKLQLNLENNNEKSDSTPTLEISSVPGVKEETPPMPEHLPSLVVFPRTPTLQL